MDAPRKLGRGAGIDTAPRDGKPVVSWTHLSEAFLDVAQLTRAALPRPATVATSEPPGPRRRPRTTPCPSNLRLAKTFTGADRDRHLEEAFEFMVRFFENSLAEHQARNPGVEVRSRKADANRSIAVIHKDGKAVSRYRIALGTFTEREITYSSND